MAETEINNRFDFLEAPEGKELFARIDFALKDGMHIQNRTKQSEWYYYLCQYEDTLKQYYQDFFGLSLESGDGGFGKYFYLNFYPEARIGIPPDHRKTMPNEFIIVGFLLYTLYFTDYNIELNSLEQFKRLVRVEYPDFKAGLNLTLAKTKQVKATQRNDEKICEPMDDEEMARLIERQGELYEKIDQCIQSAFAEFNRIGWIELEGDRFEILPAFQRLALIYSDQINDIDNLLKQALEK